MLTIYTFVITCLHQVTYPHPSRSSSTTLHFVSIFHDTLVTMRNNILQSGSTTTCSSYAKGKAVHFWPTAHLELPTKTQSRQKNGCDSPWPLISWKLHEKNPSLLTSSVKPNSHDKGNIKNKKQQKKKNVVQAVLARMAARLLVTAWKPVLMEATEHLEPQVSHWRKNRRVSFCRMVSLDLQVWQVTYSSEKKKKPIMRNYTPYQVFEALWHAHMSPCMSLHALLEVHPNPHNVYKYG